MQNYSFLLAEELNFVNIQISPEEGNTKGFDKILASGSEHPELYINAELTAELKTQGLARELERAVQVFRRESGLKVGQIVDFYYETQSRDIYDAFEYFDAEKTFVGRVVGARQKADFEKEIKIGVETIWLGLKKVK